MDISVIDLSIDQTALTAWEVALLGALPPAARGTFNFGEGTGILECFMGPFLQIRIKNTGAIAAGRIDELELWAGW